MTDKETFEEWLDWFKEERPDIIYNQFGKNLPPYAYTAGDKNGRLRTLEEMRKSYPFMTRKEIKEDLDIELKKMRK